MPHYYFDWWYEDLPDKAVKAAKVLGYKSKSDWDDSVELPYMEKEFAELTHEEKQAMRTVGLDPIDKLEEVWWEDADEETKKAAKVLGFDQHKWDHDWTIHDLPCEELYWKELSNEQRKAARYFGYNRSTWDEADYDDDDSYASDDEEKIENPAAAAFSKLNIGGSGKGGKKKPGKGSGKASKPKPKAKFACSEMYGGDGGKEFDQRMHPRIKKITIRAGKVVDGITIDYSDGSKSNGGDGGGKGTSLELSQGEFVNHVMIRAGKVVQHLTFKTNKGRTLEAGGSGGLLLDKKGEDYDCWAPPGTQLCGIKGREGNFLDAIAFRWGPIPK